MTSPASSATGRRSDIVVTRDETGVAWVVLDRPARRNAVTGAMWRELARIFTELGGLMSYSARLTEQFRRAAVYVDKILRGASAGTLPVEAPSHYELVINLKTAKALGIEIPQAVLARTDETID